MYKFYRNMQQPERCYQQTKRTVMGDFNIYFQMHLNILKNNSRKRDCSLTDSDEDARHTSVPVEKVTSIDQRHNQNSSFVHFTLKRHDLTSSLWHHQLIYLMSPWCTAHVQLESTCVYILKSYSVDLYHSPQPNGVSFPSVVVRKKNALLTPSYYHHHGQNSPF
jgi:hypothetical protein